MPEVIRVHQPSINLRFCRRQTWRLLNETSAGARLCGNVTLRHEKAPTLPLPPEAVGCKPMLAIDLEGACSAESHDPRYSRAVYPGSPHGRKRGRSSDHQTRTRPASDSSVASRVTASAISPRVVSVVGTPSCSRCSGVSESTYARSSSVAIQSGARQL